MTSSMREHRFVFLDGLRGIAATSVVLTHFTHALELPDVFRHSKLSVDFFFLLSGFVLAFAYDQRLRSGRIDFLSFATARLIRLYPMLLVGLLIGAVVFLCRIIARAEWEMSAPFVEALVLGALMLPSHVITGPGYASAFPLNVAAWSLFFQFSINALYAITARHLTTARLAAVTAVGALGLIVTAYEHDGIFGGTEWTTLLLGSWRILFSFSAGVLLFHLQERLLRDRLRKPPPAYVTLILAVGMCAALALPLRVTWFYDAICVFFLFPTIVAVGAETRISGKIADLCLFAGRLSYPLYVVHYPVVHIARAIAFTHNLHGALLILFLVVTLGVVVVLSGICMMFIDEPVRAALKRWSRKESIKNLGVVKA